MNSLFDISGKVNATLADNANQLLKKTDMKDLHFARKSKQTLVSFLDDDGSAELLSKLKPIADAKNIPLCAGLFATSYVFGNPLILIDLQNNDGWEFISHAYNHINFTTLTESELEIDCELAINLFKEKGLNNCNSILYPFGIVNDAVIKVCQKYYKSGVLSGGGINSYPYDTYQLKRIIVFGEYAPEGQNTLDYYKAQVDIALANKQYIIFETHAQELTTQNLTDIGLLVDYIQSLSIPIVTISKALELTGNAFEVNSKSSIDYFLVDCEGVIYSPNIFDYQLIKGSFNNGSAITGFPNNKISYGVVTNADSAGFPTSAGTLIVSRLGSIYGADLQYQIWYPYGSGSIYRRTWTGSAWNAWEEYQPRTSLLPYLNTQVIADVVNTYSNATLPSGFPNNKITTFCVSAGGASGFPGGVAGICTVYKLYSHDWWRQEYRKNGLNELWSRYVNTDDTWTAWVKASAV